MTLQKRNELQEILDKLVSMGLIYVSLNEKGEEVYKSIKWKKEKV